MGHAYISPVRKHEVIAGLIQEIDSKSIWGGNEDLRKDIAELLPQVTNERDAMVQIIDKPDERDCIEEIKRRWPAMKPGAYLCFVGYEHKNPGMLRAVAHEFPLLDVAVFPDNVAVVSKK